MFVGGYKFRDAGKTLDERRDLVVEVDQQVARRDALGVAADKDRRCFGAVVTPEEPVWYEAAVAERPQQLVEMLGFGAVLRVDIHRIIEAPGLLRELAREHVARVLVSLRENVEIDACHEKPF